MNDNSSDNVTALHKACRLGCVNSIKILLQSGIRPDAEAKDSITPLHVAAAFGNDAGLEQLINYILTKKYCMTNNGFEPEDNSILRLKGKANGFESESNGIHQETVESEEKIITGEIITITKNREEELNANGRSELIENGYKDTHENGTEKINEIANGKKEEIKENGNGKKQDIIENGKKEDINENGHDSITINGKNKESANSINSNGFEHEHLDGTKSEIASQISNDVNDKTSSPIEIEPCDRQKHTPLHYACADGHLKATKVLIKAGYNVNAENISQNRALHFASASGNKELCQYLINHGADIEAQNKFGQTALHIATTSNCLPIVECLLENYADPNVKDAKGFTCPHIALKNGQIDIVNVFMRDSRTDLTIQDDEENTALHYALKLGHLNLIPNMLPSARDLTTPDASGCSVIFEAIKNQSEDLALAMLAACPALAQSTNNDFVTPLHLAAERGMKNLVKELLIAGARVDALDHNGLTPSLYCAKNDSVLDCLSMIEDIMLTDCHPEQIEKTSNISFHQ